jgi:streptogramin lyase
LPDARHNYVYVADTFANTVWIFPASPKNPNPVGSITTGISEPQGLAVDASGNLYVANTGNATVTIYPPGGSTPSLTLSQDLPVPAAVAVDSKGDVWVSNEEGGYTGSLVEFPAGQTIPSTVITGVNPLGIAVDSADNLYAESYNNSAAYVAVYPPGATQPSQTFGQQNVLEPLGMAIGPTGDVYVSDFYYDDVFVFAASTHKLKHKVFDETGDLTGLTISRYKRLYVADADMAVVSEISRRGFGKVLADRFHNDLQSAYGVAADPAVAPGP